MMWIPGIVSTYPVGVDPEKAPEPVWRPMVCERCGAQFPSLGQWAQHAMRRREVPSSCLKRED